MKQTLGELEILDKSERLLTNEGNWLKTKYNINCTELSIFAKYQPLWLSKQCHPAHTCSLFVYYLWMKKLIKIKTFKYKFKIFCKAVSRFTLLI